MTSPIKIPTTKVQINAVDQKPKARFDLEERTAKFAEKVISFCKMIRADAIARPLISQIVRSATSIGANYCEANEGSSKKDFANKVSIANKEAKETRYWLRMMAHTVPEAKDRAWELWREAQELNLILAAIIRKVKKHE